MNKRKLNNDQENYGSTLNKNKSPSKKLRPALIDLTNSNETRIESQTEYSYDKSESGWDSQSIITLDMNESLCHKSVEFDSLISSDQDTEIDDSSSQYKSLNTTTQELEENVTFSQSKNLNLSNKSDFRTIFTQLSSSSKFAIFRRAKELATENPSLYIQSFGTLPTHLSDQDVKQLKRIFYKTDENIFELADSSRFQVKSQNWNKHISDLVSNLRSEMKFSNNFKIHLEKIVLYTEGAFIPRTLDDKNDSKFATLRIQIHSFHTGGEIMVHRGSERKKLGLNLPSNGNKSKNDIYYAIYFSDAEYEMLELTSGVKLELIYSLISMRKDQIIENPFAINNSNKYENIVNEAVNLIENGNPNEKYALLLDKSYDFDEFENIGTRNLKGIDMNRYELLKAVNDRLGANNKLVFYLVRIYLKKEEYQVQTDLDFDYSHQEDDSNWKLVSKSMLFDNWYEESTGKLFYVNQISSSRPFEIFNDIIDMKSTKDDFDHDSDKWWKNLTDIRQEIKEQGMQRISKGSKYMLVFWPRVKEIEFLFDLNPEFIDSIFLLEKLLVEFERKCESFQSLLSYLNKILNDDKLINKLKLNQNDILLRRLILVLIEVDDLAYCQAFISNVLPRDFFCITKLISHFIIHFGWTNLRSSFTNGHFFEDNFKNVSCLMSSLKISYINGSIIKINQIRTVGLQCFNDLIMPILNKIHQTRKSTLNANELTILFDLIDFYNEDYLSINKQVLSPLRIFEYVIMRLDDSELKAFLSLIGNNMIDSYKSSQTLLNLFNFRLKTLRTQRVNSERINLIMPLAKTPNNPEIEKFLRSNQAQFSISIKDKNERHKLVQHYNREHDTYSSSAINFESNVKITKTIYYFLKQMHKKQEAIDEEINFLQEKAKMFNIASL